MSFEYLSTSSSNLSSLKIYKLKRKDSLTKLTNEQIENLEKGYRNADKNEFIYFIRKNRNIETKWFINEQEFHLMKLYSKLENNIKDTDEQLMICKSNLNKINTNDIYALKINQIFWINNINQSQLIDNYLIDKTKKYQDLEKKLSDLIDNNLNALIILKDLIQSRLKSNFEDTIIKIED